MSGLEPSRAVEELRELRELTADADGAQRVAWTDTWAEARRWFRGKLEGLPLDVEEDTAGNVWATLPGAGDGGELVIGGHIDSVPNGGWLDGCLDLVAGLEVLRRLSAEGEPRRSVALVDWADEEGARFGRSLLGSSCASGTIDYDEVAGLRDAAGVALPDAMAEHGVDLRRATEEAAGRLGRAGAYLELHIEQGPILERDGLPLAAVTGTAGDERHAIRFRGQSVQGGGFPMEGRRDPLVAAARFVAALRDLAPDESSRSTVGELRVRPGIATAVASECEALLDQRHPDASVLEQMLGDAREACERIAGEEGVSAEWELLHRIAPCPFDERLTGLAEEVVVGLAGECPRLFSGALHDAAEAARAGVPTAMLFVQSIGGLSHAKDEDTRPEHIELAVQALDELASRTLALLEG